jgi:hypothetical protein
MMAVNNGIAIIPAHDAERSLRLFRDGPGLTETWREQHAEGKLVDDDGFAHCFGVPTEQAAEYQAAEMLTHHSLELLKRRTGLYRDAKSQALRIPA